MKISNPYTGLTVKTTPETITSQTAKCDGKIKATYKHAVLTTKPGGGGPAMGGKSMKMHTGSK